MVHTTTEHPFWDATTGQWTLAGDLRPGDQLTTTAPGTTVTVAAVHTWTGSHDMRNLTVEAIHTYYVIAGTTPVLVHNTFGKCPVHDLGLPEGKPFVCTCPKGGEGPAATNSKLEHGLDQGARIKDQRVHAEAPANALGKLTGGHPNPYVGVALVVWGGIKAVKAGWSVLRKMFF